MGKRIAATAGILVMTYTIMSMFIVAVVRTDEQRDPERKARAVSMEEIKQGWNCNKFNCWFAGLSYAEKVDRRFEHDGR